jgi:hypothetical protein
MSGSPKYTSAWLEAERARELAERRRERERERKRREQEAAKRRREAKRTAIAGELAGLRNRTRALAAEAAETQLSARHATLLTQINTFAAQLSSAMSEHELRAARSRLVNLRGEADGIAAAAAGILAVRDRGRALASLRRSLALAPDRAELDAEGAEETDWLLAEAERLLGDGDRFAKTYDQLSAAARNHLARVQSRREEVVRMRQDADAYRSALVTVLKEAQAAGASLDGATEAEQLLARLAAVASAGDVAQARDLCAKAQQATRELERNFDRWLDELDRAQLVFDAVARALPKAGLHILADSYRTQGTAVSVRTERADGSSVQLTVLPDTTDGVQIVYRADGTDFVVQQAADGELATCDLTEEMLERFHAALAAENVKTGELHWRGKPTTRPDAAQARRFRERTARTRETQ